jgi:hypothetical protein
MIAWDFGKYRGNHRFQRPPQTPFTNEPYSGDYNPIHIYPYFSYFASLPPLCRQRHHAESSRSRSSISNIIASLGTV